MFKRIQRDILTYMLDWQNFESQMAPRDNEGLKGASRHVNFIKQFSIIHSNAEDSGL